LLTVINPPLQKHIFPQSISPSLWQCSQPKKKKRKITFVSWKTESLHTHLQGQPHKSL